MDEGIKRKRNVEAVDNCSIRHWNAKERRAEAHQPRVTRDGGCGRNRTTAWNTAKRRAPP